MIRFLARSRKTDLKTNIILGSIFSLLLFTNCMEELKNIEKSTLKYPSKLTYSTSISIDVEQFLPDKIAIDVKGNIFILGNNRTLFVIRTSGTIEEIELEHIKPCELVDITTDGFDIFLLDRMNRKIWTVTRESISDKGFALTKRPLLFDVSNNGLFSVIYSNINEISIFSKTESNFNGFSLDGMILTTNEGDLVFKNKVIYFANQKNDRVEKYYLYSSNKKVFFRIESPKSLTLDMYGNLFIQGKHDIFCIRQGNGDTKTFLTGNKGEDIAIFDRKLFILKPEEKSLDVFKIIYSSADSNNGTRE